MLRMMQSWLEITIGIPQSWSTDMRDTVLLSDGIKIGHMQFVDLYVGPIAFEGHGRPMAWSFLKTLCYK